MRHLNPEMNLCFLLLLSLAPSSIVQGLEEEDPGVPITPDDISFADTVKVDKEDNDVLSANLEMAAELNPNIPLEDGKEAKVFQGNACHHYLLKGRQ